MKSIGNEKLFVRVKLRNRLGGYDTVARLAADNWTPAILAFIDQSKMNHVQDKVLLIVNSEFRINLDLYNYKGHYYVIASDIDKEHNFIPGR